MVRDSITDEIRATRRSLAEEFNNDLGLIVADLQRQQRESGRKYLTLSKREAQAVEVAERNDARDRE